MSQSQSIWKCNELFVQNPFIDLFLLYFRNAMELYDLNRPRDDLDESDDGDDSESSEDEPEQFENCDLSGENSDFDNWSTNTQQFKCSK